MENLEKALSVSFSLIMNGDQPKGFHIQAMEDEDEDIENKSAIFCLAFPIYKESTIKIWESYLIFRCPNINGYIKLQPESKFMNFFQEKIQKEEFFFKKWRNKIGFSVYFI